MAEESTTPNLEEALRRSREAASRHDFDAAVAIFALDAVWDTSSMGLDEALEGREAIRRGIEDAATSYEEFEQVLEEFCDLGNGVTLSVLLRRGRPRGSSRFAENRWAQVVTWVDGLVERMTTYLDIDEARATAERLAEERE